jgi:thymidylate synthase (FAD)
MTDLEFVSESTVKLVSAHGDDDDVCHAAWVSNNELGSNPDHERPFRMEKWVGYGDTRAVNGYVPTEEGKAWNKKTQGLINFLYKNQHMSPFEHIHMKFYIETPIFVTREFHRHRTWSYNEMSGRYTELPGRMFLIDDERPIVQKGKIGAYSFETGTDEQYGTVLAETTMAYIHSWEAYNTMLGAGIAKEVARNVLPVGTMTQFYATANVRNVMQFLLLRNDKHALKEIRDVAIQIESHFKASFPKVYKAFKANDWRDKDAKIAALEAEIKALRGE